MRGSGGSSVSPTGHSRKTENDRVLGPVREQPQQNGRERGYGTIDSDREQAPGCIYTTWSAHAARFTTDCGGRWSERRKKFRSRKFCRKVSISRSVILSFLRS